MDDLSVRRGKSSANEEIQMGISYQHVNGMLNVAYLTGFVRMPTGNTFKLQQNNNLEHAIEIRVRPGLAVPKEYMPITAICHIRGFGQHEFVGTPNYQSAYVEAVDIRRPSTRAMPATTTWVMGGARGGDDFKPFGVEGRMLNELHEQTDNNEGNLSEQELIVMKMLDATRGKLDGNKRSNSGGIVLAGFIDSLAYIPPNEHRDGFGLVHIRQHENPDQNIPVRIAPEKARAVLKSVAEGSPVKLAGRIRRKVILDEPGNIQGHVTFVETNDLSGAVKDVDIRGEFPWWKAILDRVIAAKKAAREERMARAATAPVVEGNF